jgi:hypothetical protein
MTENARFSRRPGLIRALERRNGDHRPRRDRDRGRVLGSRFSGVDGRGGGAGGIGPNLARMLRRVRIRGDSG